MEVQKNQNQGQNNSLVELIRIKDINCRNEKFDSTLNRICFSIGISKALNPLELDVIFYFLKKEFKLVTIEDIDEAFSKFSACKLKFNVMGKEVNFIDHYDKFDNRFLSRVLIAYTEFKQNEYRNKPKTELMKELPMIESGEVHYKLVLKFFQENKNWSFCIGSWNLIYEYLENEGKININTEEKFVFAEIVYEDLKEEYYQKRIKGDIDLQLKNLISDIDSNGLNTKTIKGSILALECKKRLVQKYIENNINNL